MKSQKKTTRNYNTISPSAFSLILMKGYTNIPFALRTAELIMYPETFTPDFEAKDLAFWARVLHFENRYRSIDHLLTDLSITNVLELSSGLSFRGLAAIKEKGIHYIDTDLPEMINTKSEYLNILIKECPAAQGDLEVLALNALDEEKLRDIVSHFPEGKIAIVNEGLLMYLDLLEKEKLCKNIHGILKERGGCWITADIYVKKKVNEPDLKPDQNMTAFFEQHQIEENKFNSFEEAETFFKRMGFVIDKVADNDRSELSAMKYFLKNVTEEELLNLRKKGKIQTTWRLRIAED
jgi:O-methyltransferase involved in polyketide biosynthesis